MPTTLTRMRSAMMISSPILRDRTSIVALHGSRGGSRTTDILQQTWYRHRFSSHSDPTSRQITCFQGEIVLTAGCQRDSDTVNCECLFSMMKTCEKHFACVLRSGDRPGSATYPSERKTQAVIALHIHLVLLHVLAQLLHDADVELPHPLLGDAHSLADLLERQVLLVIEARTHAEDLALAWLQNVQQAVDLSVRLLGLGELLLLITAAVGL